jgi:hypothetical protein
MVRTSFRQLPAAEQQTAQLPGRTFNPFDDDEDDTAPMEAASAASAFDRMKQTKFGKSKGGSGKVFNPFVAAEEEEEAEAEEEEDSCSVCNKSNGTLLLCDGCDTAFHLKCCKPVLRKIPKGDWFCASCKKAAKEAKEPVVEKKAAAPVAPAETKPKGRGRGRKAAVAAEPIAEEEESTWAAGDELDLAPLAETTEVKAAGKGNKRRMSWAPDNALEKVRHFRKENAPAAAAQEIAPKLSTVVEPAPKRGRKAAAVEPAAEVARRTTRGRK